MLLARLVTGRYGYEAAEEQLRPASGTPGQGWFSRLVATILTRKKTGFTLPISEKTGIGSARFAAVSNNARPPCNEPVNPTALVNGCITKKLLTSNEAPCTCVKIPSGILQLWAAFKIASATISEVSGWAGCAFTITGQPAAKAQAVSPPAVE